MADDRVSEPETATYGRLVAPAAAAADEEPEPMDELALDYSDLDALANRPQPRRVRISSRRRAALRSALHIEYPIGIDDEDRGE